MGTLRRRVSPGQGSNWWILVVAPTVVVLSLVAWLLAWASLGRPEAPDWLSSIAGVLVTVAGPIGVLGLYGDARYLERAGGGWHPEWWRYVLAALFVATPLFLFWQGGGESVVSTVGRAGSSLTEGMVPAGLYYLYRRRQMTDTNPS